MNRLLYALHRWVSAAVFVQFTAWTVSGCFFVLVPFSRVKGTPVVDAHVRAIPDPSVLSIATVLAMAGGSSFPSSVELRGTAEGPVYLVRWGERVVRLDARTGMVAPVERAEAEAAARRDQPGAPSVRASTLLTTAPVEYRDKPVPAWRVALNDPAATAVYVDATTGDVTARRNDTWRVYDFLWSLHIMDYGARDDFHHPLIAVAALLAGATVATGAVLWAARLLRWRRRKRLPTAPA